MATSSDNELSDKIKTSFPNAPNSDILAHLRRGLLEKKSSDPLLIARTLLGEAAEIYSKGDKEKAYQKAIEAYLDGFEMAEPALFAKDAAFGRSIEAQFTQFRNSIRQGVSAEEIQKQRAEIEAKLDQAAQMLAGSDDFSGYYAFLNSALIILREGLEAALILAAIIAMLRVMGATKSIRYIHFGWILALAAGVLTWLAAQTVLTFSGQHRESMEGFISIFAAAALFYVGYWLHTRTEAKRWHAFIQDKVQNVLSSKSIFGLVGISFFAVYREAFEVVLFYQALWLQNENSHHAILGGFAAGVAALLAADLCDLQARPAHAAKILLRRHRHTALHHGLHLRRHRHQSVAGGRLGSGDAAQFSAGGAAVGHLSDHGNPGSPGTVGLHIYSYLAVDGA